MTIINYRISKTIPFTWPFLPAPNKKSMNHIWTTWTYIGGSENIPLTGHFDEMDWAPIARQKKCMYAYIHKMNYHHHHHHHPPPHHHHHHRHHHHPYPHPPPHHHHNHCNRYQELSGTDHCWSPSERRSPGAIEKYSGHRRCLRVPWLSAAFAAQTVSWMVYVRLSV